jgi:hypothetical protein
LNSSSDALAGGLETLVASDYDYAKYLRDIVLEPMNAGDKGEHAYRYYMYDSSCGKFMNTLFLLALRKARSLETFKWVPLQRERSYVLIYLQMGYSSGAQSTSLQSFTSSSSSPKSAHSHASRPLYVPNIANIRRSSI